MFKPVMFINAYALFPIPEQVLNVKEDTQKQYEQLQIRYAELESK